jgi:hypothetical protein
VELQMPLARYFLWVGGVLLALLFVADACLPTLPVAEATTDVPPPIIRIHSERKWPDRIVFDTNAPIPRLNLAAIPALEKPAQQTTAVVSDRVRETRAQMETSDLVQTQVTGPKKLQVPARRQQKMASRHVARRPFRVTRQLQYAWYNGRMWW